MATNMRSAFSAVQALLIAAAAAIIVILIFSLANRTLTTAAVPFGLPAGTKIKIGEKAEFLDVPSASEQELRRADDLRMAGALESAFASYENLLLKYPNMQAALFGAAYSLLARDSVSSETILKAKGYIERMSKENSGSVWAQLLLIFTSEKEGSLNSSLEMAERLVAESPAFSEARLAFANLLQKSENPEKAAQEARAAISISGGSDSRPYVTLAYALHKLGRLEECTELANYALSRFPSQTDLLLLKGFLNEYSRDFGKAQELYKRILILKPGDVKAQNALATLGEKTPPSAAGRVASGGSGFEAKYGNSGGLSLKDIAGEAAKIILPIIEIYPENLPLREALGKIYLRAQMMNEANAQFREIYVQDMEYPDIRKLLDESLTEIPKFIPSNADFSGTAVSMGTDRALADSLAAALSALRSELEDNDDLGRYLAHYGATFKEFFSRYSVSRFEKRDEKTFFEKYPIGTFIYGNTVFFDRKKKFYAVKVEIKDTADVESFGYVGDLFGHFLKKESGILGEGVVVEPTDCGGDMWNGVIWASRDNFEILMQNAKTPRSVYIVRLHAKRFPDTGNICSYVPMALDKARVPK